ncbi:MAG TPA: gamma-glutamyl-gamma-aminobutyrate hydrolase family protein [Gemmataceae bacterium]|nr:gamma-glutamyl-gamma-aminobutyrate hydrolase family protein [Gemmataceae bacterium]
MSSKPPTIRIGICGPDNTPKNERHGCGLWMAGYAACLQAADAIPVTLDESSGAPWEELLADLHGVVLIGHDGDRRRRSVTQAESLCLWCREHDFPLLGVDHGLHFLNTALGGLIYQDVGRELPEALQHRHPPERGLRHAIAVVPGTRLADIYGEGEVVVNSEHRRAVQRVARGLRVSASALDGVVEAVEAESDDWFALGIQWHPASSTASGLDIQVFRGLVDAAVRRNELVGAGSFAA